MPSDEDSARLLKQMCELERRQKELLDEILSELEDDSFRSILTSIRDEEVRHSDWLDTVAGS